MNTQYVRLPADSTGKKIRHINRIDIKLATVLINLNTLEKEDVLTGESSGITATISGWSSDFDTQFIHVVDASGTFTNGETLSVNGISLGTIESTTEVYTPSIVMSDADNSNYHQKIDKQGSSYIRFKEGNLPFDAFGQAQFSQVTVLDYHFFTYGDRPEKYYIKKLSGGTQVAQPAESCILFSTNTTSGSISARTSNQYYPYTPGIGNEMLMTLMVGDTGKTNVIRRWGLYDDEDGLYFELSGSTFSVNMRNSSTGTITSTKVLQSQFNGDSLDNESLSDFVLDVSKYNIYFIDYQWLGHGRVRFGVHSPNGERVIIHTFQNPNKNTVPYMRRGTLPIRVEQFNAGVAASTSEMKLGCVSIQKQSQQSEFSGVQYNAISNRVTISGSSYVPLLSLKPLTTFNGEINKTTGFIIDYETDVSGSPILITPFLQATLSGSTFTATTSSFSSTTIDTDAVSMTGGSIARNSVLIPTGTNRREIRESFENTFGTLANGFAPTATFAAKLVDPTITTKVTLLVRWKEVR